MDPELRKEIEKGMRPTCKHILGAMVDTSLRLDDVLETLLKSGAHPGEAVESMLSSAFLSGVKYAAIHAEGVGKENPGFPAEKYGEAMREAVEELSEKIGRYDPSKVAAERLNPERN
jgi:ribosomal protein S16